MRFVRLGYNLVRRYTKRPAVVFMRAEQPCRTGQLQNAAHRVTANVFLRADKTYGL